MKTDNIILIGFMGSGKTSVGQVLARKLNWTFVDVDAEIEQYQKQSIPDIFLHQGESYFRELESVTLTRVLAQSQQVIATGGGAVLAENNRRLMLTSGFIVALFASVNQIIERVKTAENRPLIRENIDERVNQLLLQRKHAYDFAHIRVDTSHLTINQVAEQIRFEFEHVKSQS